MTIKDNNKDIDLLFVCDMEMTARERVLQASAVKHARMKDEGNKHDDATKNIAIIPYRR